MAIFVATLAVACGGSEGMTVTAAADVDEVLLDRGYGKPLTALDVRTCATRELPIIGREPAAFTRDHTTVATLRRLDVATAAAVPSRLTVGPASEDERATVWTVGDEAFNGIAFDPSGKRIALALRRTMDRGSRVAEGAVDDGLWIVDRSGDNRRHLVAGDPASFAWSPDGKQIASTTATYAADGTRSTEVWIVDVGSGRQRTVATLDQPLVASGVMDWSPDGQSILLFTGTTSPSTGRPPPILEQIAVADGRRGVVLTPVADDYFHRAVYASDGRTVIVQRAHVPLDPPLPSGGPSVTIPALGAPDRRRADLVSVRTDGTDLKALCPIEPDDKVLDWH